MGRYQPTVRTQKECVQERSATKNRYSRSKCSAAFMLGQSSLTRIPPQGRIGVAVCWVRSEVAMGRPIPACCGRPIPRCRCRVGLVGRGGLLVLRGCTPAIRAKPLHARCRYAVLGRGPGRLLVGGRLIRRCCRAQAQPNRGPPGPCVRRPVAAAAGVTTRATRVSPVHRAAMVISPGPSEVHPWGRLEAAAGHPWIEGARAVGLQVEH